MKKLKSIFLFLLVILIEATFFSCAKDQPGAEKSKIKIGFLVKQPEEPWFQTEWKFAEQAAIDHGFELIKIGAVDGEKTLAAIDNLAANGAKGFVICTPDVRLGPAIKAKAHSYGMKLMAVDDQFVGADGAFMADVHYLGLSPRKIGELAGKKLYEEMQRRRWPLEGTAVCASTFEELDTAKQRTDGAMTALIAAGFPENKIFKAPNKTTDIPGSFDATNILLTQHPEIKRWLVIGMNDNAVLGAIRATEGRGLNADNVIGVGINGTDCHTEFEKTSPTGFWASILLSPKRHGYDTAAMVYRWVAENVEPPLATRIEDGILLTRKNFLQVLKENGIL
jgi:L-arabinose transport system substrate-binding protein